MSAPVLSARDGAVGVCTMNRPEARNALDAGLAEQLAVALGRLDEDEGIRCIVLAGSDEVFASGADVATAATGGSHEPDAAFWRRLAAVRTPLVAAASGWALGSGCELALACDMIVAAEGTQFGLPEVTLGMIPGGGGTQRLARVLGKQRAMELVLTGRRFSAEQALAWGLVNQVSPRGSWLEAGVELAAAVSARAPIATRLAKQAILEADRSPLEAGLEAERRLFEQAAATEDRVEGIDAFLHGREPEFEGR